MGVAAEATVEAGTDSWPSWSASAQAAPVPRDRGVGGLDLDVPAPPWAAQSAPRPGGATVSGATLKRATPRIGPLSPHSAQIGHPRLGSRIPPLYFPGRVAEWITIPPRCGSLS